MVGNELGEESGKAIAYMTLKSDTTLTIVNLGDTNPSGGDGSFHVDLTDINVYESGY